MAVVGTFDLERKRKHFWCQEVSGSKGSFCLFVPGVMLFDIPSSAQAGGALLGFLVTHM